MLIYLSLTTAVLLIAFQVRNTSDAAAVDTVNKYSHIFRGMSRRQLKSRVGMLCLFVLLTGVSALRLNVGNDYSNYVEIMHRAYSGAVVPTEPGFNYLTVFIYKISGFENYVAVFAIFAAATMFFFLAAIYRQSVDFWMSFMMFMLLGYYFQSISTVRHYLAISVAMFSIYYCFKGDWPRFVILTLFGALFHKSLLVVLILYPLAMFKWKKWMQASLGILCISCLFLKDFYLQIAIKLYPSYAGTEYLSGGTSAVSILRCAGVLAFSIFVYGKDVFKERESRFYFNCNLFALLLYTFGAFLPTVSRIAYYLTTTQIFYIPMLILDAEKKCQWAKEREKWLKIAVSVACVLYFAMYMRGAANDGVRILPYETFLFHELPPTLSERGFG